MRNKLALAALLALLAVPLYAQTIRPTRISQLRLTELTTAQEGTMTLVQGDVWYNSDLACIRLRLSASSVCVLESGGTGEAVLKTPTANQSITGGFSLSLDGPFMFPESGGACSFDPVAGVNWQICSNINDLQIEHFNSGGVGRFHINADTLVGPPGSAAVSENFNSFAWDNEGSYWDGSQAQFNLWEWAVSTTPDSGAPIHSRLNAWPLFTGACAGCTADIAFGASGTNPVRGNPAGAPMWVFGILPRDEFTVTFAHSGFTANRTYNFPNVDGAIITTGSFVQHITGTAALNLAAPGAVPGCVDSSEVTINGIALGDNIVPSMNAVMQANQQMTAFASAVDKVIFRICQFAGGATDPDGAGATYRADVWKH